MGKGIAKDGNGREKSESGAGTIGRTGTVKREKKTEKKERIK